MLRCLFTNLCSDLFCRSSPYGKWIGRRNLTRAGFFYSTQATKMDLMSAADKRYQRAICALNHLQSNLQNLAIKDDLHKNKIQSTLKYVERVGLTLDDIDKLSVIHVSGTKGKGSTCAMSESILRHHGYKTGFFSSPHLVEVRERIQINGQPISRDMFSSYFWEVHDRLTQTASLHNNEMPFYFAFLTIMAFHVFIKENVDVAIMEVGIGGEYDTTNVIRKPIVCGVTSLGLDHISVLGDTIEKIAWQKGGIFKAGVPAVTVPQEPSALHVLLDRSEEIRVCSLYLTPEFKGHRIKSEDPNFKLGLMGRVQEKNAALALQLCNIWLAHRNKEKTYHEMAKPLPHVEIKDIPVLDAYPVDAESKKGLQTCSWRGRNQILTKPEVTYYIDGAHTKESLEQCIHWFQEVASSEARHITGKVVKILLFNMTGDRDISARLTQLKSILSNYTLSSNKSQSCAFDHVVFSPNSLYKDISTPDLTKTSVTQENQLNRCCYMKEIWDERPTKLHHQTSANSQQQLQFIEDLGQLPVVPVELETLDTAPNSQETQNSDNIPSSVITCLSEALQWTTQGRDPALPRRQATLIIPGYLQKASHIQILVTGSIHLVGGVLKLIESVNSPAS
ncbi:folylpolyglutamate synthase, mitochondrial-like [Liolophura sinensis]|uniref:folylpolyglutamate synthase, mitochondrial-like n=1 Tax=Liolophura sinensis TaxID=3198878 RepID=UPI003158B7A1